VDDEPAAARPTGGRGRTGRNERRTLLGLVLTYLLVLAVCGVLAALALTALRQDVRDVQSAGARTDVPAAVAAARSATGHLDRAAAVLRGPQWVPVDAIPLVGDDLKAVRLMVVSADRSADAVRPLLAPVEQLARGARRADGGLDTALVVRLRDGLAAAQAPTARSAADVRAIRPSGLVGPLRTPMRQASDALTALADGTATAAGAARVAADVLGADGPRTTVVAVQNPAEARGTGGIIGAFAIVRADRGSVHLVSTGVNDDLLHHNTPLAQIPAQVRALYGPDVADVRNVNLSPDFPVAARMLLETYRRYAAAQSVPTLPSDTLLVTVTPRALGLAVGATGPVRVPGSTEPVTPSTAAALFSNEVYARFPDTAPRLAFVQGVLRAVFARLLKPDVAPAPLLRAVRTASADHDLMAWSPDAATERALTSLGADGALGSPHGDTARVSLVNADGSKLDFYDRVTVGVGSGGSGATAGCGVAVTVRNTAPRSVVAAAAVPLPVAGRADTTHQVVVQVHLPGGVGVSSVRVDGRAVGFASGPERGWTALRITLVVPRSTSSTACVRLQGGPVRQVVPPVLSVPATIVPATASTLRRP
jgi:hypothetical protein